MCLAAHVCVPIVVSQEIKGDYLKQQHKQFTTNNTDN